MTRTELKNRLKINFDQNSIYYTETDLDDSIQDGYDEIVAYAGVIHKATTISFTEDVSYYDFGSLISDFFALVALWNNHTQRWMFPSSFRLLDKFRDDWETVYGTPEYFVPINHRWVTVYKKPSAAGYGDMYVFYKASADTLNDESDLDIPLEHQRVLERYVTGDLHEQAEEWVKAQREFGLYVEGLGDLKTHVMNHRVPDYMYILGA
jgi:hypothetical protein